MTQQFAVIGSPIAHSLSPRIHNAIFEAEGRDARMRAIDPVTSEQLTSDLERWKAERTFEGLAVTAPYKPLIAALEGERSDEVALLEAANTLTLRESEPVSGDGVFWQIDNTDVAGFTHAVQQLLSPLKYRTFVVFGTGATARTIIYALIAHDAALIQVVGRSQEKARACIEPFESWQQSRAHKTELIAASAPAGKRFDCAINATTLGISAHDELVFPVSWFAEYAATVFDVVYRSTGTTRLVASARQRDIRALDGRAMLYGQAIEQARIWGAHSSSKELMDVIEQAIDKE